MQKPPTTLSVLKRIGAGEYVDACIAPMDEFRILRELKAADYIVGQVGPDAPDAPATMVDCLHFTIQGRLLFEQLTKEKRLAGFLAQTWKAIGFLGGLFAGVVASTLVPVLEEFWKWLFPP